MDSCYTGLIATGLTVVGFLILWGIGFLLDRVGGGGSSGGDGGWGGSCAGDGGDGGGCGGGCGGGGDGG